MTAAEKMKKKYGPLMCLALVKPNSNLASEWGLQKPGYCIFEFCPAFGLVEIRWGDGSGQRLEEAKQLDDLILLQQFSEKQVLELFDS